MGKSIFFTQRKPYVQRTSMEGGGHNAPFAKSLLLNEAFLQNQNKTGEDCAHVNLNIEWIILIKIQKYVDLIFHRYTICHLPFYRFLNFRVHFQYARRFFAGYYFGTITLVECNRKCWRRGTKVYYRSPPVPFTARTQVPGDHEESCRKASLNPSQTRHNPVKTCRPTPHCAEISYPQ